MIWWIDEIYEDESEMCALALLLVLLGWGCGVGSRIRRVWYVWWAIFILSAWWWVGFVATDV